MNLIELDFHKSAGAQAEAYKRVKPLMNKVMNMRNRRDLSIANDMESALKKNDSQYQADLRLGLFPNQDGGNMVNFMGKHQKNIATREYRKRSK